MFTIVTQYIEQHHTIAYLLGLVGFCSGFVLMKDAYKNDALSDEERALRHYVAIKYGTNNGKRSR